MNQFYQSYLISIIFWTGLSLGCLGLALLQRLLQSEWGRLILPALDAASGTLPLFLFFFVPLFFGLHAIYPWANPDSLAARPLSPMQTVYLRPGFFIGRTIFLFALWSLLARARRFSAPGLVLYFLSSTLFYVDWLMSLEPNWFSTIYAAMIIIGQILSGLTFAIVCFATLKYFQESRSASSEETALDLGNILLTFVMLAAYFSFSQYLIIWSGNLPDEISWYLHRGDGGWLVMILILVAAQFFLPLFVLLGRTNKKNVRRLAVVASWLIVARLLEINWLIQPVFSPAHFTFSGWTLLLSAGLGSVWIFLFLKKLNNSTHDYEYRTA